MTAPPVVEHFRRLISPFQRAIALMIGRGVIKLSDDSGGLQKLQVMGLAGEVISDIDSLGDYGYAARPHAGAEVVYAAVGAQHSHLVIIAVGDRRYRLKGLAEGEVALYDDLGQKVHLTRTGMVIDGGALPINVKTTGDVIVTAGGTVQLGGAGGKKVVLDGDPVSGGAVHASSTKVMGT
jgi:phage baseplate assembly protein V